MGRKDRIFQQWSGVILSVITLFSSSSFAKYSGGTGERNTPYQIADVNDLLTLANNVNDYNKCFIMTSDIDLDPNLPGSQVFTKAVIASDINSSNSIFDGNAFSGIFDGAEHKILNLNINTYEIRNDFLGLFGDINNGQVKNLFLKNINITGGNYSDWLGGLVGYNDNGSIINCYSVVVITGGNESSYFGGLVGQSFQGNITSCFSAGAVNAKPDSEAVGGLVGYNYGNISHSFFEGDVNGSTSSIYIGGLAGRSDFAHITDCNTSGSVIAGESTWRVGGLIGYNTGMSNTIADCFSTSDVTAIDSWYLGGLIGHSTSGYISGSSSTGSVTSGNSSRFIGGLIGCIESGTVNNCFSTGSVNAGSASENIGGIAGDSSAEIINCCATGSINAGDYSQAIGGLAGQSHNSIETSYATGSITSGYYSVWYIGGLVGWNYNGITNCYARGNITNGRDVGGLIGYNYVQGPVNCYAVGTITNCAFFGGLIGENKLGGVINSYFLNRTDYNNGYGTPLTDLQMKQEASFVEWNFNDVWAICEGTNYPRLQWSIPAADMLCPDGVTFVDYAYLAERWFWNDYGDVNGIELTGDGKVDNSDFALFANWWGQSNCGNCGGADYSWDQDVDIEDLAMLCNYWLATEYGDVEGAELTGDGLVDLEDLAEFVQNWLQ